MAAACRAESDLVDRQFAEHGCRLGQHPSLEVGVEHSTHSSTNDITLEDSLALRSSQPSHNHLGHFPPMAVVA